MGRPGDGPDGVAPATLRAWSRQAPVVSLLRSTLFAFILAVRHRRWRGRTRRFGTDLAPRCGRPGRARTGRGSGHGGVRGERLGRSGAGSSLRRPGRTGGLVHRAPQRAARRHRSTSPWPPRAGDGRRPTPSSGHQGRNHVWMPALGIDRSVASYACSNALVPRQPRVPLGLRRQQQRLPLRPRRQRLQAAPRRVCPRPPAQGHEALLCRWRGHGPHVQGRRGGRSRRPTKGTWAYQSLARPSLTLQTCVGAASQYRLIVRLDRVD